MLTVDNTGTGGCGTVSTRHAPARDRACDGPHPSAFDGIRTRGLPLRRRAPYPLGHEGERAAPDPRADWTRPPRCPVGWGRGRGRPPANREHARRAGIEPACAVLETAGLPLSYRRKGRRGCAFADPRRPVKERCVGSAGLEPAASRPPAGRASLLRHDPFPAGRMVRHPSRRRAVPFLQGRYPAVGGGANLREASLRDPSRASRTPRDTPMPAGALRSLCGPDGGRTRCLRVANATLYRLSYRPVNALPADSLAAGRATRCRIPRQRGAGASGVRVRSIGAFDEPLSANLF